MWFLDFFVTDRQTKFVARDIWAGPRNINSSLIYTTLKRPKNPPRGEQYYRGGAIIINSDFGESSRWRWNSSAKFEFSSMFIFEDSIVASSNLLRSALALGPLEPTAKQVRTLKSFFTILWSHLVWLYFSRETFVYLAGGARFVRFPCLFLGNEGSGYILYIVQLRRHFLIKLDHLKLWQFCFWRLPRALLSRCGAYGKVIEKPPRAWSVRQSSLSLISYGYMRVAIEGILLLGSI